MNKETTASVLQDITTNGRLIVLTGPSGVGKGTLLKQLLRNHPELHLSISVTTRSPRPKEIEGQHYYFVDVEEFQHMLDQGELLEWAKFAGNFYGTPRQVVLDQVQQGKQVVLEIELEGARQIQQAFPDAFRIFILPPSLEELENRIRNRGQDSNEAIAQRLKRAQVEIDSAAEFDAQVVNDDLDIVVTALEAILFPVS